MSGIRTQWVSGIRTDHTRSVYRSVICTYLLTDTVQITKKKIVMGHDSVDESIDTGPQHG